MPSGLESLAGLYAPPQRKRQGLAAIGQPTPVDIAPPDEEDADESPRTANEAADTSTILPKNQGAFLSALQWIGRPGQVVKNVLTGNLEGAARQAGDFLGEAADAVLPGDLIPQLSRPEDEVAGADLLGVPKDWQKEHPLLAIGASLPVDIISDPLTWTGFGPLAKAAGAVGRAGAQVAGKVPGGAAALEAGSNVVTKAGRGLRSIGGAQRLIPEVEEGSRAATAIKGNVALAGTKEAERIFAGLTPKELDVAGDVADGLLHVNGRPSAILPGNTIAERIAAHPEAAGMDPVKLEQAIRQTEAFMARQGAEGGIGKPLANVNEMLGAGPSGTATGQLPIFTPQGGTRDYIPRLYKGQTEEQALDELLGGASQIGAPKAIAERSLEGAPEIIDFFTKNPKLTYTRNLAERVLGRVGQQSELGRRAVLGRDILGAVKSGKIAVPESELAKIGSRIGPKKEGAPQALDPLASLSGQAKPVSDLTKAVDHVMNHEFRLADPESRALVNSAIKGMDPESAKYAAEMFNGLPPRGPITSILAKVNAPIKKMMVMGYVIPKFGSIVRNNIGGIWQAASNPESRAVAIEQAKRLPSNLYGAVVDSLGLKIPKDALGQAGQAIESAFSGSGGIAENAIQALSRSPGAGGFTGQQLADVVRSGALSGFVSTEDIIRSMAASPKARAWKSVADWPARMFKGVEDRMRLGMGLDLLRKGEAPESIGRIVGDSLYSYDISSSGNRAIRDFLPYAQFSMKAGAQQAKLLHDKPWLAVALSSLLTEKEGQPTYSYMGGRLNVPLGQNEEGGTDYVSGFGLPFEALTMIPNPSGSLQETGREIGRTLVSSSQPVLKSIGTLAFGQDPYFGTKAGSYSKLPGNIEGGEAGRIYNILAGTGLIGPVSEPLRLIGKIADDRRSPGVKALDVLTGANVVSVDPDKALQQRLTEYLRANPDLASIEMLYSKTDDPEAQALIRQLTEAKKRIKAKRAADTGS